jgi:hypothetical protein
MKKLTILNEEQRIVLSILILDLLFLWASSLALIYHFFIKQVSKGEIIWIAMFLSIFIFMLIKFPFLRFKFKTKNEDKKIGRLRIAEFILASAIIITFGPLIVQLTLMKINHYLLIEFSILLASGFIIFLIEKFIIPTIRISQKVNKLSEGNN